MSGGPRRYSIDLEDCGFAHERLLVENAKGDVMKWEDHERATVTLRARIDVMTAALKFYADPMTDMGRKALEALRLASEGDRS